MALRRSLIASWVFLAASLLGSRAAIAKVCSGELHPGGNGEDLEVKGKCTVRTSGTYTYGNVNVYGKSASLIFEEPKDTEKKDRRIDFWAKAILVENDGSLEAGTTSHPFGASDGVLTIHLYGKPTDEGIACKTPGGTCGVPDVQWTSNPTSKVGLPGDVNDYFYKYEPLPYGSGFFGNKVLAVSYGGSLRLYGKKGATSQNLHPSDTGRSWVRLAKSVKKGEKTLVVDVKHLDAGNGDLDWQKGDQIVVTTTDYLPGHSEELELASDPTRKGDTVILDLVTAVAYPHHGERFKLTDPDPKKSRIDPRVGIDIDAAETRAAVALLTRSIRIVSGDETAVDFPAPAPGKHYGGHTIIRQGFETVQIQGVEFRRLGQGGRRAHYPIHFYRARQVPNGRKTVGGPLAHEKATVVRDCSVNESMNRWVVLNATQGVVLGRNVGWKSIGHGFYMEEGTETDNKFQSNIGIYARPAVKNATVNPREVPGILSAPVIDAAGENVPFYSDVDHPYVFFIMNGWNEFEYNMAAGAGTCGGCYWLVPGANSGASRFMKWEGYAAMQQPLKPPTSNGVERAALTPLHVFRGNYCTSAMNSFNTIGETSPCLGINGPADDAHLDAVPNPLAPASCDITNPAPPKDARACSKPAFKEADDYYPKVDKGGGRFATRCDDPLKCSTATRCADAGGDANRGKPGDPEKNCMVTILDRYTSSFHWTETNFGAIWLRPQWYLYTNSVLTDVQNGGLSLVTGGGYTRSDTINGHWALARKSVFIGSTQTEEENPYTSNAGPFNKKTYELDGFKCDNSIAK
ncbi:MAG TPA: G8 domain-containing protein, partial [Thermoanaerobaculia bacterium]|nr:G8 domain-containing protein [Thermoanaerobaculia bacterium]